MPLHPVYWTLNPVTGAPGAAAGLTDLAQARGVDVDVEDPEQVEREDEQHRTDRSDEERLLELESPADRMTGAPEEDDDCGEDRHRAENAAGVGKPLESDIATALFREVRDRDDLDREDW